MNACLSTDKILNAAVKIFQRKFSCDHAGRHLDIGSGAGTLVELIKKYLLCSQLIALATQMSLLTIKLFHFMLLI